MVDSAAPDGQETTGDALDSGKPRTLNDTLRLMIEWVAVGIVALVIALLIKAFLVQAFWIPSESMTPTLNIDDRVLVNKLSYRTGDISRGDLVVFEKPDSIPGSIDDFIKRVIGLPGETISFVNGDVLIDGVVLAEDYIDEQTRAPLSAITSVGCTNTPAPDRCTLAEGYYFMMGDNRSNSTDSRSFGPIAEEEVIGRAFVKIWPLSDFDWF